MAAQLPETMTAYRFTPGVTEPVATQMPVPRPEAEEVLVKVFAAGVCHSDVMILNPESAVNKLFPSPFTMGHEGAGVVVLMGSCANEANPQITVGTYVAIYGPNSCFTQGCAACSSNRPNLCRENLSCGLGGDGAWAEYLIVRAACVVPVPASIERVPPGVVAIATDAILTPYHAMTTCSGVSRGSTVLVNGAGGLGANAIAIAKHCLKAGTVVACDIREASLAEARKVGADHTVSPDQLVEFMATNRLSADFAIDIVGTQESLDACYAVLRHGGTIHILGLTGDSVRISPITTMRKDLTVKTSYWGTKNELVEVLQALSDGLLNPTIETRPMSQCGQVLADMHHGKLKHRVALIPDGLEL